MNIQKIIQVFLFVAVSATLLLWPYFQALLPAFDSIQLLGVIVAILLGSFLYFDSLIRDTNNVQKGILHTGTLSNMLIGLCNSNKHVSNVKIFAISTGMIQPLVSSSSLKIGTCKILVRGFTDEELREKENQVYASHINDMVRDWEKLVERGRIATLEVERYYFTPTEYNIIFDGEHVLVGLYSPNGKSWSTVDVEFPYVINKTSKESAGLIEEYEMRFDKMWQEFAEQSA